MAVVVEGEAGSGLVGYLAFLVEGEILQVEVAAGRVFVGEKAAVGGEDGLQVGHVSYLVLCSVGFVAALKKKSHRGHVINRMIERRHCNLQFARH